MGESNTCALMELILSNCLELGQACCGDSVDSGCYSDARRLRTQVLEIADVAQSPVSLPTSCGTLVRSLSPMKDQSPHRDAKHTVIVQRGCWLRAVERTARKTASPMRCRLGSPRGRWVHSPPQRGTVLSPSLPRPPAAMGRCNVTDPRSCKILEKGQRRPQAETIPRSVPDIPQFQSLRQRPVLPITGKLLHQDHRVLATESLSALSSRCIPGSFFSSCTRLSCSQNTAHSHAAPQSAETPPLHPVPWPPTAPGPTQMPAAP